MKAVTESKEIVRARLLEKNQQHDEAAMAYLEADLPDEAARVLIEAKRFKDAGNLLLRYVRVPPLSIADLDNEGKQRVLKGALCLWRGAELRRSYQLLLELGDTTRAMKILEEIGDKVAIAQLRERIAASGQNVDPTSSSVQYAGQAYVQPPTGQGNLRVEDAAALEHAGRLAEAYVAYYRLREFFHAARMAAALGRHGEAAQLLESIQLYYEAAVCYRSAGNERGVLESLKRIPPNHPQYRKACHIAIQVCAKYNELDDTLLHFLRPFRASTPMDERDAEAFYALGILCHQRGAIDIAYQCFRPLATVYPNYMDALARANGLEIELRAKNQPARPLSASGSIYDLDTPDEHAAPPTGWTAEFRTSSAQPGSGPMPVAPASRGSNPGPTTGTGTAQPAAQEVQVKVRDAVMEDLKPGDIIADRYEVQGLLGRGGMACVYRCKDSELDDIIAMKIFTHRVEDAQLISRFKQEVQLSRQLSHPNIVRLYDFGTHAGLRYITMELLQGAELGTMIGKPMELVQGLGYLIGACNGMAAVHARGVIHRDLKPANFFVTNDDVLKIMDFGIAKKQGKSEGMTVQGFFAGTPEYMSPEQIQSFSKVNHLTDLYALGIITYELFTGQCPFTHEEMGSLLMMHLTHQPKPPREISLEIPEELQEVILQLLEKDQKKRIQSCEELAKRFTAIRDQVAASAVDALVR